MKVKSYKQIKNLDELTVLLRVDFNVALDKNKVKEDFKIKACLPMLEDLKKAKARVILVTHLGDPVLSASGKLKASDKVKFSTEIIAKHLTKKLKVKCGFSDQKIGSEALQKQVEKLKPAELLLLDNIRFYPGETTNDKKFAKQLGDLADVYINNAFAVSHRNHASVAMVKKYLPSFAGPLLEIEVSNLNKIIKPLKPLVAIIGGAKIDTKVNLVKRLLKKADSLIVGGALANNFIAAQGHAIGKSLVTESGIKIAKKLMKKNIILPIDVVVQDQKTKKVTVRLISELKKSEMILDLGPVSMKKIVSVINKAQTIIWNGPMGKFEDEKFRFGTMFVARAVAARASGKAFAVVGGGETIEAVNLSKSASQIDWISTGGGASLAYLSGETMPGLKGLVK